MVLLKNNSGKDVMYPVHQNDNPYVPPSHKVIKAGEKEDLPIEYSKIDGFELVEPLPEEPEVGPVETRKRKKRE